MRAGFHRDKGYKGNGHPIMFGDPKPALDFGPFPEGGGYPLRFLEWAYRTMAANPDEILHVCSGSMRRGVTVDLRVEKNPSVVADGTALPFRDELFKWVLIDPPYSEEYSKGLYKVPYAKPFHLVREACRVLKPGGLIGFMHFQVPTTQTLPLKYRGVWGITQGPGFAIRAWTMLEKGALKG